MPFQIIRQDITKIKCDAIVNPTDEVFSGSGGTDYAVHTAAGPELAKACASLGRIETGTVEVTDAFGLPCSYVFHTVGPVWAGGTENEEVLLRSCYLNALLEAEKRKLSSIAFPLISSGSFGFPKDRVLRIAVGAISDFLFTADSEMQIYVCILDRHSFATGREIALSDFLDTSSRQSTGERHAPKLRRKATMPKRPEFTCNSVQAPAPLEDTCVECFSALPGEAVPDNLEKWLREHDDSFALTLLKLIDRKGMTEVECYKKANVTKGTFWKIKNDEKYRPSKATAVAFAIALRLDLEETEQFLKTAGFSLSRSTRFDMIIRFYIMNGIYDIFEINEALFQYDQPLLGCNS